MFNRIVTVVLSSALLAVSFACDEKSAPAPAPSAAHESLPTNLIATNAPQGAKDLSALRKAAKDGEDVVLRGVIAGRAEPFTENRAVFTLLDTSIKTCDKNPGDGCKTPWDACCEPAEVIAANIATVQVVDAEGKPIKAGLKGVGGLAPLRTVIVTGKYKPSADGNAIAVNAESIHVEN